MLRVKANLEANGLRVWFDQARIPPGTVSWQRAVEHAIDRAACFLVIFSPAAKESRWVRSELFYAEAQKTTMFYILASGDISNAVPMAYIDVEWVDIRDKAKYDQKIQQLIATIGQHLLGVDCPFRRSELKRIAEEKEAEFILEQRQVSAKKKLDIYYAEAAFVLGQGEPREALEIMLLAQNLDEFLEEQERTRVLQEIERIKKAIQRHERAQTFIEQAYQFVNTDGLKAWSFFQEAQTIYVDIEKDARTGDIRDQIVRQLNRELRAILQLLQMDNQDEQVIEQVDKVLSRYQDIDPSLENVLDALKDLRETAKKKQRQSLLEMRQPADEEAQAARPIAEITACERESQPAILLSVLARLLLTGEGSIQKIEVSVASILVWLPLLIPLLGLSMETLPARNKPEAISYSTWSIVILLAWGATIFLDLYGNYYISTMASLIGSSVAITVAFVVAVDVTGGTAVAVAVGLPVVVAVGIALGVVGVVGSIEAVCGVGGTALGVAVVVGNNVADIVVNNSWADKTASILAGIGAGGVICLAATVVTIVVAANVFKVV